jgi:hypothetical protein
MPTQTSALLTIILVTAFALPGCSYMTAQGRREMAYRHYVNSHVKNRQRQIAKASAAANRKTKHDLEAQAETPSEPRVSSGVERAAEPTSAPITVSASESEAPNSEPNP